MTGTIRFVSKYNGVSLFAYDARDPGLSVSRVRESDIRAMPKGCAVRQAFARFRMKERAEIVAYCRRRGLSVGAFWRDYKSLAA